MGKIIFEFDSVEEANEAQTALQAGDWKLAVWEMDQYLRKTTKYGTGILNPVTEASSKEIKIAEKIREELMEILDGYNLKLD